MRCLCSCLSFILHRFRNGPHYYIGSSQWTIAEVGYSYDLTETNRHAYDDRYLRTLSFRTQFGWWCRRTEASALADRKVSPADIVLTERLKSLISIVNAEVRRKSSRNILSVTKARIGFRVRKLRYMSSDLSQYLSATYKLVYCTCF